MAARTAPGGGPRAAGSGGLRPRPSAKARIQAFEHAGIDADGPGHPGDWKAIGVEITLAEEEGQIAYQDLRVRNFEIGTASWIEDYDDATSFLGLQQSKTGAQNYGDYNNPVYDGLLAKADNEPNAKIRAGYLAQAEAIMLNDATVAPISFVVSKNLVSPKITGWVDNPTDWHRVQYLCVKK